MKMFTLVINYCWTQQTLEIICKREIFTKSLLKKYALHDKIKSYYFLSTNVKKKLTIAKLEEM